jgi:hypothetical protein
VSPRDLDIGDDDGPALVRPYAMVRGRTRPRGANAALPVEAIVITIDHAGGAHLGLEPGAIVRLCVQPHSIAEVSALLHVPVGVARVLVSDLADQGLVHINLPAAPRDDGSVDRQILERVLAGLEAL